MITVSEAAKRDVVAQLDIPSARVFAVLHGPNQEGSAAPSDAELAAVRQKYGLPPRYFLYLGGFDVRKNVRSTLQAYRGYLDRGGDPGVRLVVAGKLPPADSAFFPDPKKSPQNCSLVQAYSSAAGSRKPTRGPSMRQLWPTSSPASMKASG